MYSYNLLNSLQPLTAITNFSLTFMPISTWRCVSLPSYQTQNCSYVGSLFREDKDEVASVFKPLPTLLEFCLGIFAFWMCLVGSHLC